MYNILREKLTHMKALLSWPDWVFHVNTALALFSGAKTAKLQWADKYGVGGSMFWRLCKVSGMKHQSFTGNAFVSLGKERSPCFLWNILASMKREEPGCKHENWMKEEEGQRYSLPSFLIRRRHSILPKRHLGYR